MENQRLLMYTGLAFLLFLLWQTWQTDYVLPKPMPTSVSQSNDLGGEASDSQSTSGGTDVPAVGESTNQNNSAVGELIEVETDVMKAWISKTGGNIVKLTLSKYSVSLDEPDTPLTLLDHQVSGEDPLFHVVQSGLLSLDSSVKLPDHKAAFESDSNRYLLDGDRLDVPLSWQENGVKVTKTLSFEPGSYQVKLAYNIDGAPAGLRVKQYQQIKRTEAKSEGGLGKVYSFTGGVYSEQNDAYERLSFSDMNMQKALDAGQPTREVLATTEGGWVAMIQHYFVVAALPNPEMRNTLAHSYANQNDIPYYNVVTSSEDLAAGDTQALTQSFFIGPKIQDKLAAAADKLELTVDYGWLSPVSQFLFTALSFFHDYLGNWGWAIVAVTFSVKLFFYPLSKLSYTSMAKMKKLTPKIQAIREQNEGDQAKIGQETMALYKREKVNPLSGCLPILIQFPIFLGLYFMLSETVELRQAPWILWIKDLSIRDPYFVLPSIYMITMYIQQSLNPPPADPIQAKIFKWMPIMFGLFFMFFPSGLVLYWVVNNILTITQQWLIMRNLDKADQKKAG